MTQPPYGDPLPPYGDQPRDPYGGDQQQPPGQPPQYPQQELLPQQVQPGRSRWPLIVGAVAVLAALVVALVVWRVVHDDGEQNRAAYCTALKKATGVEGGFGGLAQIVGGDGAGIPRIVDNLRDLAPDSVKSEWEDLIGLAQSATGGSPDIGQLARGFTDLQAIISDANSECGMHVQFPG